MINFLVRNFQQFFRFFAIAILLLVLFFSWSFASAVGSSSDEDIELINIWCGHQVTVRLENDGLRSRRETTEFDGTVKTATQFCKFDPRNQRQFLLPKLVAEPQECFLTFGQNESAACQRNSQELISSKYFEATKNNFYVTTLRNLVSPFVEASVVKMRLFNSFLAAVLIAVVVSLDRQRSSDWFLGWLAVIAPVTVYFIASVNSSGWALTGTTCFVFGLLLALRNRGQPKIWVPASVIALTSAFVANASRREAKYVLLILTTSIVINELVKNRNKIGKMTLLLSLVALPVMYIVFNFFTSVIGFARFNIFNDPRVEVDLGITTTAYDILVNNVINLPRFIIGFFGGWGLGWFELELTSTVWLFTLQTFLLTIGFAFFKSSKNHRVLIVALFGLMCMAIIYAHQQRFAKIFEYIQPRYFLPFFLGILIIAAANKKERYPQSLVVTVAILSTIANSIALRDTIRRYTTGQDVFISKSLNNPREWWWNFGPQPETIWLTGTLAFAALYALLIYERRNDLVESDPVTSSAI